MPAFVRKTRFELIEVGISWGTRRWKYGSDAAPYRVNKPDMLRYFTSRFGITLADGVADAIYEAVARRLCDQAVDLEPWEPTVAEDALAALTVTGVMVLLDFPRRVALFSQASDLAALRKLLPDLAPS